MKYKNPNEVQSRVLEHHNKMLELGYEVVGTFAYGSWNYGPNMTDEESDVDTKCLVLPSFHDFCMGKKSVSTTYAMENNEHCDVKDLRLYMRCFEKQDVNFVEVLFTDYFVLNPRYEECLKPLFEMKEDVARYNVRAALNCMVGMGYEKQKAMCHPYKGKKEKLEKYGYDGKQLSHCMRLEEMMDKYIACAPYKECLTSQQGEFLTRVKRNKSFTLEDAKWMMDVTVQRMKEKKDKYFETHDPYVKIEVREMFDEVVMNCMETNFINYLGQRYA